MVWRAYPKLGERLIDQRKNLIFGKRARSTHDNASGHLLAEAGESDSIWNIAVKKFALLLLAFSVLLAACGPDKIVYDLPSPSGKYHAQVRSCPETGSITWGEQLEVNILEAGVSEDCHSDVQSFTGFKARPPGLAVEQLQLEWLSDTQFRAWYPGLKPNVEPSGSYTKYNTPVQIIYLPKP